VQYQVTVISSRNFHLVAALPLVLLSYRRMERISLSAFLEPSATSGGGVKRFDERPAKFA